MLLLPSFLRRKSLPMAARACLFSLAAALAACSPPEPLKLGFIAGTSGRVADLGVAGRNGTVLAVEQRNAKGGIHGHPIELLLKDDQQNVDTLKQGITELIDAKVLAILGPMTSSMAVPAATMADQAKVLIMVGTATTNDLTGKDDMLLRTLSPTRDHARVTASFLYKERGLRNLAATLDMKNQAYTESWLGDFATAFESLGGNLVRRVPFESSDMTDFAQLTDALVAPTIDGVLIVSNSVDASLIIKDIRLKSPQLMIATSEWAGTERLIELGGTYANGVVVPQYLDRDSTDKAYQDFYAAYVSRFNQEPGYAGMIAYNAANVVLDGLENQKDGTSLRDTILGMKRFQGLQGNIEFDEFGDARSRTYITEIRDGAFRVVD